MKTKLQGRAKQNNFNIFAEIILIFLKIVFNLLTFCNESAVYLSDAIMKRKHSHRFTVDYVA